LQAPQWLLLVWVLTQEPEQSVVPVLQTHWPLEQTRPVKQAFPHAPQWLLLVLVLTQAPPQLVSEPVQTVVQEPFWQT
jgi:hypothetical protein